MIEVYGECHICSDGELFLIGNRTSPACYHCGCDLSFYASIPSRTSLSSNISKIILITCGSSTPESCVGLLSRVELGEIPWGVTGSVCQSL